MSESGKVSLPMTPERKEEIEFWYRVAEKSVLIKYVSDLLAALEESQQRIEKLELYVKSLEFSRDDAQKMAHDIEKEKGLELFEAQQTIARLESEKERFDSLMDVLKDATELMSWRDPGGGRGQVEALKIIYKWLSENPSPSYLAALQGNKEGTDTNG